MCCYQNMKFLKLLSLMGIKQCFFICRMCDIDNLLHFLQPRKNIKLSREFSRKESIGIHCAIWYDEKRYHMPRIITEGCYLGQICMLQSIWKTPFSFYGFLNILQKKKVFPNHNIEENIRKVAQSMAPLCLKDTETGLCRKFLLWFWVEKWRKKSFNSIHRDKSPHADDWK